MVDWNESKALTTSVNRRARIIECAIVVVAAIAITLWLTFPLGFQMPSRAIELGDSLLNAYLQAWVTHAFRTHAILFDTNMLYPAKDTLALSENMLGNQPLFAPVYLLTKNPILALNCVILSSFVFCALTMYLLVRYVTVSPWAGAVAGMIFAFAPVRLSQLGHMQLLSMYWMPLIVLFLYRYLQTCKLIELLGLSTSVALQVLCSLYLGYMALLVALCFFLGIAITRPQLLKIKVIGGLALGAILVCAVLFPVMTQYTRLVATSLNPRYDSTATIAASASPIASYFEGSGRVYCHLFKRFHSADLDWEKHLFTGLLPLALALLSIGGIFRKDREGTSQPDTSPSSRSATFRRGELIPALFWGAALTVLCSYVLSLGPILRIHDRPTRIRLPFFLLQQWVPGVGTFRVPARFGLSLMLGLAVLSGIGFLHLLHIGERRWSLGGIGARVGLTSAVLVLVALEFNVGFAGFAPVMTPDHVSPEYKWLTQRPSSIPILEVPMTRLDGTVDPYAQNAYIFASTFHWHPLVNGYSGHLPLTFSEMFDLVKAMPAREPASLLAGLGIRYIIVHTQRLSEEEVGRWTNAAVEGWLYNAVSFPGTVIYELPASLCRGRDAAPEIQGLELPRETEKGKLLGFSVFLFAGTNCWADATTAGETQVVANWQELHSGAGFEYEKLVPWPLYVRASEPRQVRGFVQAPRASGLFRLSLRIGPHRFAPREIVLRHEPLLVTSMSSPSNLSAEYELRSFPKRIRLGRKADVEFLAKNTGKSVWLSDAPKGFVGLGYRWLTPQGNEVANGRVYLPFDVYPGDTYTFREALDAPPQPGAYTLRLELVSELVTWFHDRGVQPVDVPVNVDP
jgi:hypothetical protein